MADIAVTQDQETKIRLGESARAFLGSREWIELVKPIIDSMVLGLRDATTIDVSSDKKAAIEVKARTEAARYLLEIQTFLEGYVSDADTTLAVLDKKRNSESLYKSIDS